jgi:peptidyl-prolyl cis-trans isomerase D
MLSALRKLLENWVARGFFGLLIIVFVFWGISNVLTLVGNSNAIAHVGGKPIDAAVVQAAYQTALNTAQQTNPSPNIATRQQLARTALSQTVRQTTLNLEAQHLGVVAPDSAVRQFVYAIPAFQANGVFSQAQFNQVLQANNRSPDEFLADVKNNLVERQLLIPMIAGAAAPTELVNQIFAFVAEQRFAELVTVSLGGQKPPALPPDTVLQRYWRNHQAAFTAPEFRNIKLVLLAPALLAPREAVADADVAAAYARATAGQTAVPLRSVQVITTDDPKKAATIAAAWRNGADWAKVQADAKKAGLAAVELDNAEASAFPSTVLAQAVFAAPAGDVTGPVQGPFGLFVFKVTNVSTNIPPQDALKARIKQQLQLQLAQQEVARDVDNLQDALAGQTPLDQLPGNLGLTALTGTLDANGNAPDGNAAPIPGGPDLKAAVIKATFAAQPGQAAQLQDGPNGSYFALTVDKITPPSLSPYNQVQSQVAAAWTQDQIARMAEVKAAALLAAVNGGQSLDDAASAAGDSVTMSPPVTRNAPPANLPPQLVQILFSLKPGQAAMQQTSDGFMVAALVRVEKPTPDQDPQDYGQVQQAMTKSMQNDLAGSFIAGLQGRDHVTVDQKLFAQIYQ